jgi:16S rRNA (uracil1498-N3)-methyltransferase
MLQSQQCWLPLLHEPVELKKLVEENKDSQKFIAHCLPQENQQLHRFIHHSPFTIHHSSVILIGPEGDFTENEIQLAMAYNFQPVALGNTRLRTETAAIVASVLLRQAY